MSKKESSKEDLPMQRVLRQREMVEFMKHENEVLKLDLTRESRDAKMAVSTSATANISRYSLNNLFFIFVIMNCFIPDFRTKLADT
jgi:hypothetical protein